MPHKPYRVGKVCLILSYTFNIGNHDQIMNAIDNGTSFDILDEEEQPGRFEKLLALVRNKLLL